MKLSTPKTPNGASATKSASKGASTVKGAKSKGSSGKKTAAAKKAQDATEEESSEANTKPEEKPMTEAELREKRKKNLLYLRHKVRLYYIGY